MFAKKIVHRAPWFLAVFSGMTVVQLGDQTDKLGAQRFWLVSGEPRRSRRWEAAASPSGLKFPLPIRAFASKI